MPGIWRTLAYTEINVTHLAAHKECDTPDIITAAGSEFDNLWTSVLSTNVPGKATRCARQNYA